MFDAHAHVFPSVQGRTGQGRTRSLTYGRIQVGVRVEQLLEPVSIHTGYPFESLMTNLDWSGIDGAMLLQGPFYGTRNEYQAQALAAWPDRLWGALYFDPWEDAPSTLMDLVETGLYRALKLECTVPTGLGGLHPELDLAAPDLKWIWDLLEEHRLTLTLDLGAPGSMSYQTAAVADIARNHPGLRVVIAHLGQPNSDCLVPGSTRDLWLRQLDLGQMPNVWLDCAALPAYFAAEEYPYPSAVECMRFALDRLGADSILWGTDQPGVLQHLNLRQMVRQARHYAADLNEDEWRLFTEGNCRAAYGPRD